MEAKTLRVLQGTDALTKGDLENVTVTDDQIILDAVAGRHVLYGCYTSQPIPFPEFDALMMGWNAETPKGTAVEAQAQVMVDGNWTSWVGFGRWSPFIRRSSGAYAMGPLQMDRDILFLNSKTATEVRLRIYLFTDDEASTPKVRLLSASVHPVDLKDPTAEPQLGSRQVRVPGYSQLLRAPSLNASMDLPTCLTGMMNRYGEDVLPEELALAMYDWRTHSCASLTFGAAVAGCWGYYAHPAFMHLGHLWQELRAGNPVAVRMNYTTDPDLAGEGLPYLPEGMQDAADHFVVVTGFSEIEGVPQVLVNDSLCPTDAQCARILPVDRFLEGWDGIGILLHKKDRRYGWEKPQRQAISLKRNPNSQVEGNYLLCVGGQLNPLPEDFCGTEEEPTGVLAVTYMDPIARATTAHKAFRFVPVAEGGVHLIKGEQKIKKTVYAIDFTGSMLVGDVMI